MLLQLVLQHLEGTQVNLANALLIVINGIIQDPEVAYFFEGGTSFSFIQAPKPEDNIDILINNAGITGPTAPLWEYDVEMWNEIVQRVNCFSLHDNWLCR